MSSGKIAQVIPPLFKPFVCSRGKTS
ncbi:ATP synthase beta chain [Streptococcus pneumoniae]|nr:ATP synthase beta chain [Streptococcus pneumoniae]